MAKEEPNVEVEPNTQSTIKVADEAVLELPMPQKPTAAPRQELSVLAKDAPAEKITEPPVAKEKPMATEGSKLPATDGPVKVRIELPNPVEEDLLRIK